MVSELADTELAVSELVELSKCRSAEAWLLSSVTELAVSELVELSKCRMGVAIRI